ncbi:MAG TPA: hypothetical protein VJ183_14050 [Chloroflexia bacterium]|nr:hypothetical protein [Chloroflexia bacterium]
MTTFLLGVGGALVIAGVVWVLQGLNILPGSFMTGQPFWAWAGAASFLSGAVLLALGLKLRNRA